MKKKPIEFLRKKDYEHIKDLKSGGCGRTILVRDNYIDELFVCKKYDPYYPEYKEELYKNFVQEIKLMHLLYHKNIVRVFNYYLYPESYRGYILMEYIEGENIQDYLMLNNEMVNEIFLQVIEGFIHLEENNILHRDIRIPNILINNDGIVKIIDFGFGKKIEKSNHFNKSISLNWWCEKPKEFEEEIYNFSTEVYFVGKLFEKIITENNLKNFEYFDILKNMCQYDYENRVESFGLLKKGIVEKQSIEISFDEQERRVYSSFSNMLYRAITKIEENAKYNRDFDFIHQSMQDVYSKTLLEEKIPSNTLLIRIFLNGTYYFSNSLEFRTSIFIAFKKLIDNSSLDKKQIIFNNLFTKLDSIERYEDEEFPF